MFTNTCADKREIKLILGSINATYFSFNVMGKNNCLLTEYGAILAYGGHLYSPINAPEQEQKNNFEMGGIS